MSNQDEMMGKRQDAAQGEVAPLQKLASYPLEEFAKEGKPSNYPLFAANDWKLTVGDVLAARAAITTPTPSAETIDTPEFRRLACDLIDGGGNDCEELFALVAHIDARMAAARQEGWLAGGQHQHEVEQAAIAAAREQALAALVEARAFILNQPVVATGSRMDGGCTLQSETPLRVIGNLDAAIRALKSQPAQEAKAQPEIQPAAGLADMPLRDRILKCSPGLRLAEIDALEAVFRDYAQQPAQAVAVPDTHVLAPKEPTPEMLEAAMRAPAEGHPETASPSNAGIYRAMLAAAPTPPAAPLATHEGKAGDAEGEFVEKFMCDMKRDAERYRWLRMQDWFDGTLCVLRDPKRTLTSGKGLGADCPSRDRLDAFIDVAMQAQQAGKAGA